MKLAMTLALLLQGMPFPEPGPPPSDLALSLARALEPRSHGGMGSETEENVRRGLESRLLQTHFVPLGVPCDPDHPECARAARAVAAEYAPRVIAWRRALTERAYAFAFDDAMTAAQMEETLRFLATPAGRALAEGLRNSDPMSSEARYMRFLGQIPTAGDPMEGMHQRFYDRTAGLPRMSPPGVPAPAPVRN